MIYEFYENKKWNEFKISFEESLETYEDTINKLSMSFPYHQWRCIDKDGKILAMSLSKIPHEKRFGYNLCKLTCELCE